MVYIEFNTGPPDVVGKVECGDIRGQEGETNGVTNML